MATKTWQITKVSDLEVDTLDGLLAAGWEPFAVVFITGAGLFHYLRILR